MWLLPFCVGKPLPMQYETGRQVVSLITENAHQIVELLGYALVMRDLPWCKT